MRSTTQQAKIGIFPGARNGGVWSALRDIELLPDEGPLLGRLRREVMFAFGHAAMDPGNSVRFQASGIGVRVHGDGAAHFPLKEGPDT